MKHHLVIRGPSPPIHQVAGREISPLFTYANFMTYIVRQLIHPTKRSPLSSASDSLCGTLRTIPACRACLWRLRYSNWKNICFRNSALLANYYHVWKRRQGALVTSIMFCYYYYYYYTTQVCLVAVTWTANLYGSAVSSSSPHIFTIHVGTVNIAKTHHA